MAVYNHKQVLRQLEWEQGSGQISGDIATSSALVVEAKFVGEGLHKILLGFDPGAGASRSHVVWGVHVWQKCIGCTHSW